MKTPKYALKVSLAPSRKRYTLLSGALLIAMLAGCTSLNKQDSLKPSETAATAKIPLAETLPNINLTKGLLFQLMLSEIAAQRGSPSVAHLSYLQLARETRDPRIAKRAAQMALASHKLDAALEAAQLWVSLSPNSREAIELNWALLAGLNKVEILEPLLTAEITTAKENQEGAIANVHRALAQITNRPAAYDLGQKVFATVLRNSDAQLALAQLAYAAQENGAAIKHAQKALTLAPTSQRAVLVNAQLFAIKDPGAAISVLETFLKRQPSAREVRVALARQYATSKNLLKAKEQFEILAQPQTVAEGITQTDADAVFALGVLSMQVKDWPTATKYFKASLIEIEKDPKGDPTNALLSLAAIAEEQKQFAEAVHWYELVDTPTQLLTAQIRAALALSKATQYDAALGRLTKLKPRTSEDKTRLVLAQTQVLRDGGNYSEAFEMLNAALSATPDNTDLVYDRAMLAEKLNRLEEAEEDFKRIIELKPESAHAYNALGYMLADRNLRLPEAQAFLEKAVNLAPDDAFILDSLGWLQYRQGRMAEALKTLRQSYQLRADPEIAAHLGEVLWVNGQRDEAQQLWRNAQKNEPHNETLRAVMLRLHVSFP